MQACLENARLPVVMSKKKPKNQAKAVKLTGYNSIQRSIILNVDDQRVTQSRRSWMARSCGQVPSWMPSKMMLRSSLRREPDLRQIATIALVLETGLAESTLAYLVRASGGRLADDSMTG